MNLCSSYPYSQLFLILYEIINYKYISTCSVVGRVYWDCSAFIGSSLSLTTDTGKRPSTSHDGRFGLDGISLFVWAVSNVGKPSVCWLALVKGKYKIIIKQIYNWLVLLDVFKLSLFSRKIAADLHNSFLMVFLLNCASNFQKPLWYSIFQTNI